MPGPVAVVIAVALSVVGLSPGIPGNLLKVGSGTLGGAPMNKCEDFEILLQQLEAASAREGSNVRRLGGRKFELADTGVSVEFPSHNCKHVFVKEDRSSIEFERARSTHGQSLLFKNYVRNDALVLTIEQFEREYMRMRQAIRTGSGEPQPVRAPVLP